MILRIDHISIAVKDYPKALHFFKDILGAVFGAGARNNDMKYHWQIFSFGDLSRLELITPLEENTFLTKFLNKNKTCISKRTKMGGSKKQRRLRVKGCTSRRRKS
jgi:methylmalonyl-CoA/ethylmalonyl-CoA epimerase